MARPVYPSDKAKRFLIRMDDELHKALAESAKHNGRSMNAEVVARLELSVNQEPIWGVGDLQLATNIFEIAERLRRLEDSVFGRAPMRTNEPDDHNDEI